jgi:hypothetical protein
VEAVIDASLRQTEVGAKMAIDPKDSKTIPRISGKDSLFRKIFPKTGKWQCALVEKAWIPLAERPDHVVVRDAGRLRP